MKRTIRMTLVALSVVFMVGLHGGLLAAFQSTTTVLTTIYPIEIPGQVLEPGTYSFERIRINSNRNLVRIINTEKSSVVWVLAIADHRPRPDNGFRYLTREQQQDSPAILTAIYYGSDTTGLEFVFPKDQAHQLAEATKNRIVAGSAMFGPIVAMGANGKEIWMQDQETPQEIMQNMPADALSYLVDHANP